MKPESVELTNFAAHIEECPDTELPDVALSGRSNVGKSSLVNLLTGKKGLAYISKSPGKTQVLTYYQIDERWHLVDMPGYGFARVPPHERRRWATTAKKYFHGRKQLAGVIQLIDIRVGPTPDDKARLRELVTLGKPLCLAMTKADKLPRSKRDKAVGEHLAALGIQVPADTAVVMTSALKGFGHEEIWSWVEHLLARREAV
jgi:GTP-binding protein